MGGFSYTRQGSQESTLSLATPEEWRWRDSVHLLRHSHNEWRLALLSRDMYLASFDAFNDNSLDIRVKAYR